MEKSDNLSIEELVDLIKTALERDCRIKMCKGFARDKALQISTTGGETFNLRIYPLDKDKKKIR